MSWVTSTRVRPASRSSSNRAKQRSWKPVSPIAITSSNTSTSASTWVVSEKASRSAMPDDRLRSFIPEKSSSSAKRRISGTRRRTSLWERPSITPLVTRLSVAVRSAWKPTPSSMNGASRPETSTAPPSTL